MGNGEVGQQRKQAHSNWQLNYDDEHTKPATRLDHRHKLNKANLKQKLRRQKKVLGQQNFFVGFLLDYREMSQNESNGKMKGNTSWET